MVRLLIILTSACIISSALAWTSLRNNGQHFLSASMQPEVVAKTLSKVENAWKSEAIHFLECEASEINDDSTKECEAYFTTFNKSCVTVVGAILQGSNGDKSVTREYMVDICSQSSMTLWRRDMCIQLSRDLTRHMLGSAYTNRMIKAKDVCGAFWFHYVAQQRGVHQSVLDAMKAAADQKRKDMMETDKHREEIENFGWQRKEVDAAKKQRMEKEAELEKLHNNLTKDTNMGKTRLKDEKEQFEAVEAAAQTKMEEATQLERGKVKKTDYVILTRAAAADMPEPKVLNKKKQPLKASVIWPVASTSLAHP